MYVRMYVCVCVSVSVFACVISLSSTISLSPTPTHQLNQPSFPILSLVLVTVDRVMEYV